MPLHWTVHSNSKLVTVVAEGDVTRADIEAYLAMVVDAGLVEWRKLFDARNVRSAFTIEEVEGIGVRIREAAAVGAVGPIAFVVPELETPALRRLLGFLAAARRPMRLFRKIEPARRWIMKTKI